jgi:hypothetical protein
VSQSAVTIYQSAAADGSVRQQFAGVSLVREDATEVDTGADGTVTAAWATPGPAGVPFNPHPGDRFRGTDRRWWVVTRATRRDRDWHLECRREAP